MKFGSDGVVCVDGPGSTFGVQFAQHSLLSVCLKSSYEKFPDGSDNIFVSGLDASGPLGNLVADRRLMFFASFHSNDATMQCLRALIMLLESRPKDVTLVVPFLPSGTMERVDANQEGRVATANTTARLISSLPSCGRPVRVVVYDLHTLGNRFYFHTNAVCDIRTPVDMLSLWLWLEEPDVMPWKNVPSIDTVFFPDEGAKKRFGAYFAQWKGKIGHCSKVRRGEERAITLHGDVDVEDDDVFIIDDLVRTGGTLVECAKKLRDVGARRVHAFCTHAPTTVANLLKMKETGAIDSLHITDSVPTVAREIVAHPDLAGFCHVHPLLPFLKRDLCAVDGQ